MTAVDAADRPLRAVVLTYDRYRSVAEHMVARYRALWPDHPFVFRIPYQSASSFDGGPVEMVPTPPGIKDTVLTLLDDLPDDEWIVWALDDKYPVALDLGALESIVRWLRSGEVPAETAGVLFCRCRQMLEPAHLGRAARLHPAGVPLLERVDYQQIWIHQFLRVAVVRTLFEAFPDRIAQANSMDDLKDRLRPPPDQRLFVSRRNHAVFGESTDAGRLTLNCAESLDRNGFRRPDLPVSATRIILGEGNPWLFRATLLAKRLPRGTWPLLGRLRSFLGRFRIADRG